MMSRIKFDGPLAGVTESAIFLLQFLDCLFDAVQTRRVQREELATVDPELLTLRNLNTPEDYMNALKVSGLGPTSRVGDDTR